MPRKRAATLWGFECSRPENRRKLNMSLNLFASLWLGVSTNVDNLGVGVAYGMKRIRIGMMSNMLIAFFNASATFLSMVSGETISRFLPTTISGYAGNCIIILIGIWGLINTFGF